METTMKKPCRQPAANPNPDSVTNGAPVSLYHAGNCTLSYGSDPNGKRELSEETGHRHATAGVLNQHAAKLPARWGRCFVSCGAAGGSFVRNRLTTQV